MVSETVPISTPCTRGSTRCPEYPCCSARIPPRTSTLRICSTIASQSLNTARAIATAAERAGRSSVTLQSLATIRETLRLIREFTGLTEDPAPLVEELRAGQRLARALASAIREKPSIGPVVAGHLDALHETETVEAIRALSARSIERTANNAH